jgi:transposase
MITAVSSCCGRSGHAARLETRLANLPPCLIGMEACVGAHHLSRKIQMLGHDARLMPAKYVRPYSKGQKNDLRDAEAIAEAVQRPTMKFVATKTADQLDLQALHRVRDRLAGQRTGVIVRHFGTPSEGSWENYKLLRGQCTLSADALA